MRLYGGVIDALFGSVIGKLQWTIMVDCIKQTNDKRNFIFIFGCAERMQRTKTWFEVFEDLVQ